MKDIFFKISNKGKKSANVYNVMNNKQQQKKISESFLNTQDDKNSISLFLKCLFCKMHIKNHSINQNK